MNYLGGHRENDFQIHVACSQGVKENKLNYDKKHREFLI